MKLSHKIVLVLLALLALGGGGYFYYTRQPVSAQAEPAPVETAIVRSGDMVITVAGTGSVVPTSGATLGFRQAGAVAEVNVAVGDRVAAGQSLARLETNTLALQIAQAEASLGQAQARLAQTLAGYRAEDIAAAEASLRSAQASYTRVAAGPRAEDLAAAQASLRSAQANYDRLAAGAMPEEIAIAQADLDKAAAAVRRAQADYDRVAGNADVAASSQALALEQATQEYNKAQATYKSKVNGPTLEELVIAQAQVDQAQAQLDELKNTPTAEDLALAQAQVDQAQAQVQKLKNGYTAEEIEADQGQVDQAQAALALAQLSLEQATLTAPLAGTVTAVNVEIGEWIGVGQPAVVLNDMDNVSVCIYVEEPDMGKIAVGNPVLLTFEGYPGVTVAGQVTQLEPALTIVDGIPVLPVWASIEPGASVPLFAGMTVQAEITAAEVRRALLIPISALRGEPGAYAVFVVQPGGKLKLTPVTIGVKDFANVQILSGLQAGDEVSTGMVDTE